MDSLIHKEKAIALVMDACMEVLRDYETEEDAPLYQMRMNIAAGDAVLKCNKKIREALCRMEAEKTRKPVEGRWLPIYRCPETKSDPRAYLCSRCGAMVSAKKNFCPDCGADTRRGDE